MKLARLPFAAVLLTAVLGACGGESPSRAPDAASVPTGSKTALERNAADANRLVGEGTDDLKARLAALKGHPIVVNQWASWCGPCRAEFPYFAEAVRRHGDRVAFVGVNYMDSREAAQAFLEEQPPGFASVYDRDGEAARAIGGGRAMPTTLFIGRDGHEHVKLGSYADAAELETDIRRLLLAPEGSS